MKAKFLKNSGWKKSNICFPLTLQYQGWIAELKCLMLVKLTKYNEIIDMSSCHVVLWWCYFLGVSFKDRCFLLRIYFIILFLDNSLIELIANKATLKKNIGLQLYCIRGICRERERLGIKWLLFSYIASRGL